MRTFISINIPEKIKRKIIEIQDKLPEFVGKKTERQNLHLTLKFLGEVSEERAEQMKEELKKINFPRFESEIDSPGVFNENFIKIIWLHMTNCGELQKEIDNALSEFFSKEDRFMSHLTIARVKNIKDKRRFLEQLKKVKIPNMKFAVEDFHLKKSILTEKEPIYEIIETYNLK